jgi:hypothetical protein
MEEETKQRAIRLASLNLITPVIQSCRLNGYPHIFHIQNRTPATFYCKTPNTVHSAASRHRTLQAHLSSLFVRLTTPGQLSATTNQATRCTWCGTQQNQAPLKMRATHFFESSGENLPSDTNATARRFWSSGSSFIIWPWATATLQPGPTQHNSLDRLQIRK